MGTPSETALHMAHVHASTCLRARVHTPTGTICVRTCMCVLCPHVHVQPHLCHFSLMHRHEHACRHAHMSTLMHMHAHSASLPLAHTSTTHFTSLAPHCQHQFGCGYSPCAPLCPPSTGATCPHTALLCCEYTGDTAQGLWGTEVAEGGEGRAQTSCTPSCREPPNQSGEQPSPELEHP